MNNKKMEEPILMAFQNDALNSDKFAKSEFKRLQKYFNLKIAIETGTCLGYTTSFLASFYNQVRTIEINEKYLQIAKANRLNKCKNVTTYLGSSKKLMSKMLKNCTNKTFVFLDAHWNDQYCPLKDELNAIATAGIEPVIAIHDFVVPNHTELGYDSIKGQPFNFAWLKPEFDAIYGEDNYSYHYNSNSEGAKRGIIYVCPIY